MKLGLTFPMDVTTTVSSFNQLVLLNTLSEKMAELEEKIKTGSMTPTQAIATVMGEAPQPEPESLRVPRKYNLAAKLENTGDLPGPMVFQVLKEHVLARTGLTDCNKRAVGEFAYKEMNPNTASLKGSHLYAARFIKRSTLIEISKNTEIPVAKLTARLLPDMIREDVPNYKEDPQANFTRPAQTTPQGPPPHPQPRAVLFPRKN